MIGSPLRRILRDKTIKILLRMDFQIEMNG